MDLTQYSIPIQGKKLGTHQFDFHLDKEFFEHFDSSPVSDGDIDLTLHFDKRIDLFVLTFHFEGTLHTECDRCLAGIDLPVEGNDQLIVKFSLEEQAEEADVIYINPDAQKINVAKYIYEYVMLSMPMIKVYDCEEEEVPPCDLEMLQYLNAEAEDEQVKENPIWDELKKLKNDN
ncbi:MAG: DUF177 domain-containing protein [Saprospiraceae bacterium]|nr:DUF177 domain-containing protein [Saprospiraceae bacterium]